MKNIHRFQFLVYMLILIFILLNRKWKCVLFIHLYGIYILIKYNFLNTAWIYQSIHLIFKLFSEALNKKY